MSTQERSLQAERTALSWRRTLLALAAGSLVSVRLLPPLLGSWAVAAGLSGVVVAALLWLLAARRLRGAGEIVLDRRPRSEMPGGALLLALTAVTSAGAVLAAVLAAAIRR